MLEDKLLILKFKYGSSDAFRRIYEKYRSYLLKIAIALLHDVSMAEDIVHDVFTRFVKASQTLNVNGSLRAYLRICVVNSVRNKIRNDKVRSYVELSQVGPIVSDERTPDQWSILKEEFIRVNDAMLQIPFEQREVVVLHLYGNMKFLEIAELQAVSSKTVQSRYRYGLDKLRSIMNCEVEI